MAFKMNLSDLNSPQYSAGTGRKRKSPYTSYLTGMESSVREGARQDQLDSIREKEYLQGVDQFNAQQALQREQMDIAAGQNQKASMIGAVNTGVSAAAMADRAGIINLKDIGSNVLNKIWPETTGATTAQVAAPAAAAGAEGLTGVAAGDVGAGIAENAAADAAAAEAAAVGGNMASSLGGASLSSIAGYAMPWVAAAKIGMPIFGKVMGQGFRDAFGIDPEGSNTIAQLNRAAGRGVEGAVVPLIEEVGGVDLPDIAEFAINPPGYLLSKVCIIVTACTAPDSPEVNIAREYRDRHLSPEQRRGYYMIAEKVVPLINRFPFVKRLVKRFLVDNLIAYGRCALGKGPMPGIAAFLITRVFLWLCKTAGQRKLVFVRSNGEFV